MDIIITIMLNRVRKYFILSVLLFICTFEYPFHIPYFDSSFNMFEDFPFGLFDEFPNGDL